MSPETGSFRRDTTDTADPRVVEALEIYLQALEAGERPNRENFLALHAEIASALAPCLDGMEWVKAAARSFETADHAVHAMKSGDFFQTPVRLGDYRIERELGRGGMGIVYEAIQESLGRRVALKVLPLATALDPRQRQRFRVEAQAAAHLHHTHIVPVFAIGSDQGIDYYAMQYIEGRTLADLVRELRELAFPGSGADDEGTRVGPELGRAAAWLSSQFTRESSGTDAGSLAGSESPLAQEPTEADVPTSSRASDTASPSVTPGDSNVRSRNSGNGSGSADSHGPSSSGSGQSSSGTHDQRFYRYAARLGQQAAEALGHAHGLGVVHRDIKPANLMVDHVGELWVTDFGLARFQEDLGLTHTGDVLGTLRYMSPEQALGRKTIIDHRADLYSLGATLYELVTLKPPFDAKNRQALLRQIAEDEPVSPGRINPRVPRDLQTIVLKAMAKDPSQRYASAEELAEDLRRFQEDRPILARRPSVIERSARWARRHRTLVASSFVFLFLLAVGSGIAATLLWQERRNISETLAQSLHSVSELLEMSEAQQRLAEDYALDTKHLPRLQDLATRTLGVYERLAARNPRDRESRFQIARAYSRVASILDRAGREPDGLAARQKAEPILAAIVREQPAGTSYAQEYAEVLLALAESDLGAKPARMDDADRRLNEALELLNPGGNAAPADAKRARLLASCYHLRGGSFGMRAKNNERMESWVKARDVLETAVKSHPEDPELRLELAHLLHDIGQYYRFSARSSEARESLEEAITNLDQLIETDPDDPKYRELAAENYFVLSCPMVQGANGKSDVASRACARAVEEWLRLIRDFPQIPKYREDFVGKLTFLLPLSHMYTGEWTDVERIEQVAREQLEWLRERYPRNESYKQLQIQTLYNIMRLWAGNGRPKEALPRAEEILKLEPNAISALNDVAWYLAITTNLEERDLAQAETLLRRVLAVQSDSSPIWNSLGMVLLRQERYDECVQVLEKAIALPGGACGENWYLLAAALKRQGKPEEARRLYDKAEEAYKAQKYPNPDLKTCRNEAAQALGISLPAEAPQPFDVAL